VEGISEVSSQVASLTGNCPCTLQQVEAKVQVGTEAGEVPAATPGTGMGVTFYQNNTKGEEVGQILHS